MKTLILITLVTGAMSAYAPGVFETVNTNRIAMGDISHIPNSVGGYIALEDSNLIGESVLACWDTGYCTWLLVTDCCGIADGGCAWLRENGIAGEVDHETWVKTNVAGEVTYITIYLPVMRYPFN